jgi:hypothetical protein
MTTVWRIAPDSPMHERVQELAKREMRPVANMLKVLVGEALFARQLAEGKAAKHADLVSAIRGQAEQIPTRWSRAGTH